MTAQDTAATVDLTATQYVILSENQRKKAALAFTKDAYSKLQAENQALLQQLEESNRESYQVSEQFRQELLGKNQKITELQAQVEQVQALNNERIEQIQQAAAAREMELQTEFESLSNEMMERIEQLQEEVQGLLEFKQHKAETEAAMSALREEAVGLREALDAQRTQLERHYAGLHAKMRKEYEQKLEELKRAQEEELEDRLDAGVKRILAANRRLAEELRLHVMESDALQSEVSLLTADRARLTRELSLKSELEAGWALRAGQQATALKESHAKVTALEKSLQQVMADFAAERASVVSVATAQVNAAGSEVEALRRLLRLKGRELQQLRHLAQEVLLQRSEVEIFLLSSLHQVRLSIEKERAAGKQPAGVPAGTDQQQAAAAAQSNSAAEEVGQADLPTTSAAGSQPPGGSADSPVGMSKTAATVAAAAVADAGAGAEYPAAAGSLDIRDLGWVDRERVLRLLFAKINGKAAERRAAALPAHPFDAAIAAADAGQQQVAGTAAGSATAGAVSAASAVAQAMS